jgi:hypothetical protein
MEPADLNSNSSDDTRLEKALRAHFTAAPLTDGGFSQRVLASVPAPVPASAPRRSLRPWLCAGGALAGCYVARSTFSNGSSLPDQIVSLIPNLSAALAPLTEPAVGLALLVTVVSLVFVYWRDIVAKLPR